MQIVTITKKPEDEATKTLMEQELKRPTRAVPILTIRPITIPNLEVTLNESSSRPSLSDPILEIFVPQQITQVIDITPPEPQVTQREGKGIASVPYDIHGKIYQLTNDEIQAHLDKEEDIKKKAEQAKLLEMTKTKIITFKKIWDAGHQVHKRQHIEKAKRLVELKKKRTDQYMWTISSILKPEPMTDVKIHPNSKSTKPTVYRENYRRNFQKKNKIVGELMTSLGKRYECLKKILEELGMQSALPALNKLNLNPQEEKESIWN
ncbi:hypothetical protein Tco_1219727 [Tanacetum coccineum]